MDHDLSFLLPETQEFFSDMPQHALALSILHTKGPMFSKRLRWFMKAMGEEIDSVRMGVIMKGLDQMGVVRKALGNRKLKYEWEIAE